MCRVNDAKRREYSIQLTNLNQEYDIETNKMIDLVDSREELQILVNKAQRAIDNLENCDFGGDRIISAVKLSQRGYKERVDYYRDYMMKCKEAMESIYEDIDRVTKLKNRLPINCGHCAECKNSIYYSVK